MLLKTTTEQLGFIINTPLLWLRLLYVIKRASSFLETDIPLISCVMKFVRLASLSKIELLHFSAMATSANHCILRKLAMIIL